MDRNELDKIDMTAEEAIFYREFLNKRINEPRKIREEALAERRERTGAKLFWAFVSLVVLVPTVVVGAFMLSMESFRHSPEGQLVYNGLNDPNSRDGKALTTMGGDATTVNHMTSIYNDRWTIVGIVATILVLVVGALIVGRLMWLNHRTGKKNTNKEGNK